MNEYLDLFGTFAKVGVMTFGGGYAMLPILQREIVETEQNLRSLQDQAATTNATLAKIDEAGEKLQNIGSSVENVGKKFLPVTAAASSNANTNVSMMGKTFKYCAPIAGALGFSAEDP